MALRNNQNPQSAPGRSGSHGAGSHASGYSTDDSWQSAQTAQWGADGYQQGYAYAAAQQGYGAPQAGGYYQPGYQPDYQYAQPGYQDGYQSGQPGFQPGYAPTQQFSPAGGYQQGYAAGYAPGYQAGYQPGYGGGYGQPQPPEPPRKKGKAGLVIAIVLLVVGLVLLIGAGVIWFTSQQKYADNAAEYHELAQANVTEDATTGRPVVDFAALQAQNPEIVGWVQIPGTAVNYPVAQHADNEYYLDHSFLGRYDEFGAIFMDYRSTADLSGRNIVLYGHHLKNGEMFAQVADYSDQATFDTLQNVYYVSEDGTVHVLVPLSCMVVNGYDVDAVQTDFADQASFEAYVQSLLDRSSARSATASAVGINRIYMLSTCSYAQDNDRTILVLADLTATNGPVVDATQSMNDIQAAADEAAGITDDSAEA